MTPMTRNGTRRLWDPTSAALSIDLYKRLKAEYAPTGLAHFGQGKWYPGEPLPRWSLNCFWRRDGEPIWQNPELLADESQTPARPRHRASLSRERLQPDSGCHPRLCLQPTRMLFTMSGESAGCPLTSTTGIRGWTMHRKALASLACSTKGSTA